MMSISAPKQAIRRLHTAQSTRWFYGDPHAFLPCRLYNPGIFSRMSLLLVGHDLSLQPSDRVFRPRQGGIGSLLTAIFRAAFSRSLPHLGPFEIPPSGRDSRGAGAATDGAHCSRTAGLFVRFAVRALRSGDLRLAGPKRSADRDPAPETLWNHDLLSNQIINHAMEIMCEEYFDDIVPKVCLGDK